jgi:cell division GTPase FtsZ
VRERLDEKFDYIVLFPNNTFLQEKQIEEYLVRFPAVNTTTIENLKNILDA